MVLLPYQPRQAAVHPVIAAHRHRRKPVRVAPRPAPPEPTPPEPTRPKGTLR
ncbi:hypothetical protein CEDDRAFT_03810 [Frankia sp. CeD]|nr:hypothetical protein CEDDRAFT_03810 [Frankia sp. CeD]